MRGVPNRARAVPAAALAFFLSTCESRTPPAPPPGAPTTELSRYGLAYRILEAYPDFFWCDPDYYPIGSVGEEERNAIEQFPAIRANAPEFAAILEQLMLPDMADYTPEEKLSIYREHKKLTGIIQMIRTDGGYDFSLRTSHDQGLCIEGSISLLGEIHESTREPCFNTCPICLTKGTLIDTPDGLVPVQDVTMGFLVWTMDEAGNRMVAPVIDTIATPVPPGFAVVEVALDDGRTVRASPGHPTADWRPLGDYRVGEKLDGRAVASIERVRYEGGFTYDLRPAGSTGLYWANGVLLMTTLAKGARPELSCDRLE